jgi:hypothetical protein
MLRGDDLLAGKLRNHFEGFRERTNSACLKRKLATPLEERCTQAVTNNVSRAPVSWALMRGYV